MTERTDSFERVADPAAGERDNTALAIERLG